MSKADRFEGERLVVVYDESRCLRAEQCIAGSRAAFDRERDPWVDPDALPSIVLTEIVERCPSGALWAERVDGSLPETPPPYTRVRVMPDGPLHVHGPVTVMGVESKGPGTRFALCRCGASKSRPLCDGQCGETGFTASGEVAGQSVHPPERGACRAIAIPNGPLMLRGWVEVRGADAEGDNRRVHDQVALCRCGASHNKPYCDGSHNKIDFRT